MKSRTWSSRPIHLQRQAVAVSGEHVPVDGFMGDVEAAAGQTGEKRARVVPGERRDVGLVVLEIGDRPLLGSFGDDFRFHSVGHIQIRA